MPELHIREVASWKSVNGIEEADLPHFTVLAGLNGAGKTHLLQALENGSVQVVMDGGAVSEEEVLLYDWTTLAMHDPGEASTWQIDQQVTTVWQQVKNQLENGRARQVLTQGMERLQLGLPAKQVLSSPVAALPIEADKRGAINSLRSSVRQALLETVGTNRNVVEAVESHFNKNILELDRRDFLAAGSLISRQESPLKQRVSQVFLAYEKLRFRNDSFRLRAEADIATSPFLSEDEFTQTYGPPPWDVMNGLLADRGLDFVIDAPAVGAESYVVTLRHRESDIEVPLANLSSGEKILIALAMSIYGLTDQRHDLKLPRVMLLDEVDAPLHPAMTRTFLHMLDELLIKNGVAVLATTHNPSTVALAPRDSIVWMTRSAPRLTRVSQAQALARLTSGLSALTFRYEERRAVMAESGADSYAYTAVLDAIQPRLTSRFLLAFVPATTQAGSGGASIVLKNVKMLRDAGADTVFGVIDRDTDNKPASDGSVVVMGPSRYTLENYLFDPLLVAALLVREKLEHHVADLADAIANQPGTWRGIDRADSEQLQAIVDAMVAAFNKKREVSGDPVLCELIGGESVRIPRWFLDSPGHDLFDDWASAIPQLRAYRDESQLREAIISLVVPDVPGLLSRDFLDLMKKLAE